MVDRVFGPSVSPGVPIAAGSTVKFRVRQASGLAQTLSNVRFGIMQVEPQGQGLVALPESGGEGGSLWVPAGGDVYSGDGSGVLRHVSNVGAGVWNTTPHTETLRTVVVNPNNEIRTSSHDDTVKKIDPGGGSTVWTFTSHTNDVWSVALDEDGNTYTAGRDGIVYKLDPDGVELWSFNTGDTPFSVEYVRTGHVYVGIAASVTNSVYKLDASDGTQVWHQTNIDDGAWSIASDPTGNAYIAQDGGVIEKIDPDGAFLWQGNIGSARNYRVAADADHCYVAAGTSDDLYKLDGSDGSTVWTFTGHSDSILGVDVDPDGNVYSASSDNTVRKIDPVGNEIWSFTGHTTGVVAVAVMPGRYGAFG